MMRLIEQRPKPLRYRANGQGHIEYLIVERKVVAGNQRNASLLLGQPVVAPDLPSGFLKLLMGDFTGPELFTGLFEFAVATDSWIAEVVSDHVVIGKNG